MPLVLIDAFGEGIDPPQAWKAPEVLVGGGEGRTVLDGQSGEDGIGYQWAGYAVFCNQVFQNCSVTGAGLKDKYVRMCEKFVDDRKSLSGWARAEKDSWIRATADQLFRRWRATGKPPDAA